MTVKQKDGLLAPDSSTYVTITDGAGNLAGPGYPTTQASGAVGLQANSGNVAAAVATATLAGAAGVTTYLSGFAFTYAGATAASVVTGTITGLLGGTQSFTVPVPTGATSGGIPIVIDYNPPIPASATNTSIVVSVPSLGAGNTNATVSAWGYRV